MIVLPVRLSTLAPLGTFTSLTRAATSMCPALTRSSASSTGLPPEPLISVAPSSAITPSPGALQAASSNAKTAARPPVTGDRSMCGREE